MTLSKGLTKNSTTTTTHSDSRILLLSLNATHNPAILQQSVFSGTWL